MAWKVKVLVVANQTAASDELLAALSARAEQGPVQITLLVPATGGGPAGKASAEAKRVEALGRFSAAGLEATGVVGDADPVIAVHETWDPRAYDEVLVSTLPGGSSRWVQADLPHRVARLTGVPVTHVIAAPLKPHPRVEPVPQRVKEPLGPLSVLSWRGAKTRG